MLTMKLFVAVGRLLIGTTFGVSGYGAVRDPKGRATVAAPTLDKLREIVPLPKDDALLVQINGGAQVAAGATLGLGIFPRLSALILAGSLAITTYAGHEFWKVEHPEQRNAQKIHFLKNLAMLGGLLVIAGAKKK